jgi:hypothetical protein
MQSRKTAVTLPQRFDAHVWAKWQRWAEVIKDDLLTTVTDQASFRDIWQLVQNNSKWVHAHNGGLFWDLVFRSYVAKVVVGIRRHVQGIPKDEKASKKSKEASLLRLLDEMGACAGQVTFDFYLTQFPRDPNDGVPWQDFTFKKLSTNGRALSSRRIARDKDTLERLTRQIKNYANRTTAHLDSRGFQQPITYGQIHKAVMGFNRIVCKYIALITSDGYHSLQATVMVNWRNVLEQPMIRPRPRIGE